MTSSPSSLTAPHYNVFYEEPRTTPKMKKTKTFIALEEGKLHYKYQFQGTDPSDKKLVVFLHGIGSYNFCFSKLAREMVQSNRYKVLRFDLFGRGDSDNPQIPHTADYLVQQLYRLLQALDLHEEPFVLIGHSMGGALACLFAHRYPSLVEHMILLSPAGLPWKLPLAAVLLRVPFLNEVLYSNLKDGNDKKKRVEFYNPDFDEETVSWFLEKRRKPAHEEKYVNAYVNSFNNFPLQNLDSKLMTELASHHRRTLILWGQYDVTVPWYCFESWYKAFNSPNRNHLLFSLKDTRHSFHIERRDMTMHLIREFLEGKTWEEIQKSASSHPSAHVRPFDSDSIRTEKEKEADAFWDKNKQYLV